MADHAAAYDDLQTRLRERPATWLVTGAAGFIGSHLVEHLLLLGQNVVGLDDFSTGRRANLNQVQAAVGAHWGRFTLYAGDVADADLCRRALAGVDYVLHEAALGSVPRSIEDPLGAHRANVDGFLTLLVAARDAGVSRFVYASSSSVYGDHPDQPKIEHAIGEPLSPYALTKAIDEQYAHLFARVYGFPCVGLRYFNVFGPRQDPNGAYAAVIPRWADTLLRGEPCTINGDGETSRDFCYVANVVQANLLAATTTNPQALDRVYNIAVGERTTLDELFVMIRDGLAALEPGNAALVDAEPLYGPFRAGDVRHSLADISLARQLLAYAPTHTTTEGMRETLAWYLEDVRRSPAAG